MPRQLNNLVLTLLLSGLCFGSSACAQVTTPVEEEEAKAVPVQANLGVPFDLGVGQTAQLSAEGLELTFRRVSSDSRCPVDVVCVWAGEAKIVVDGKHNRNALGEVELVFPTKQETKLDGYPVEIQKVAPPAHSKQTIDPQAYVVTLLVKQG